jgi:hypothetical protein
MAIYRQIHISFWQDNFVLSLTPEEKFFYLYLMTNSKTSQCGIYEIPEKVMTLETGYNDETVNKLLNKFIKYGKIDYNKKNKEIFITNWAKYNCSNSPKIKARIESELKHVKTLDFVNKYLDVSIQYGYSIDTEPQREEEEEREEEENTNPEYDVVFNSWNAFADMKGLTKIVRLTDKRKANIKNRLVEKDFNFDNILIRIDESPFLKGKNKEGWRVDFDFIFGNKNNYIKILEGKYSGTDKRDSGASPEQLAAIVARRFAREQEGN